MIYAGFFRRFAAALIDMVILSVPGLFISGSIHFIPVSFGIGLLLGLLYKPVFESSSMSATPGKALLGIAVLGEDGSPISYKKAAIRYLTSYLSMAIMFIGYLMQPFTAKRQTLHDMLSVTVVVRKESADVNYFVVWSQHLKELFAKL